MLAIRCHIYERSLVFIIVLNVHAPSEEKSDDSKEFSWEIRASFFNHFPKYNMKILFGDFNAKVGGENIFKPTIGNDSLHQDINDIGVRILNSAATKFLVLRARRSYTETFHK